LEELAAFAPVEAVRGNMDDAALKAALPERRVVSVGTVRLGLVHIPGPSVGREGRLVSWFPGCDAVVYGHTHVPQLERHRGVWIVNPGSPTERRRAPQHSMAVLKVEGRTRQFRLTPLS
jgi:hypothetical protein